METIDEQLREAINTAIENGWSVNAIAKNANVPQPSLHRWVTGERPDLALSSAVKLATWLGMRLTKPKIPKRSDA